MPAIVCAYIDCSDHAWDFSDDLLVISLQKIQQTFGDVPVYYSARMENKQLSKLGATFIPSEIQVAILKRLLAQHATHEQDSLALFYHFYPLLDSELALEALERHNRYLAHLTYGENIPLGFIPDYLSLEFIKLVPDELQSPLREFVFKNIETYDVELFYKLPDLRQFRLDLSTKTARSVLMIQRLLQTNPDINFAKLEERIQQDASILRPYPSCFEIELCGHRHVDPIYKPQIDQVKISPELLDKLLEDIAQNGMQADATLLLSGAGDALLYDDLASFVNKAVSNPHIANVIIETWLTIDDIKIIQDIFSIANSHKISLLVRLSAGDGGLYRKIYQVDLFNKVFDNMTRITQMCGQQKEHPALYVEMLRMNENDAQVDAFMKKMTTTAFTPLLGKFNRFIDLLPDRRAVDLTPIRQEFCWHLARDFYLNVHGEVAICKQDPACKRVKGYDFSAMSVAEIYAKTLAAFRSSLDGKHEQTSMPCLQCDEWYTFNM